MGISVDGFVSGPDGEIDWQVVDDELHQHMNDELRGAAAFYEGRVVHELMESYWPTADDDPDATAVERQFAASWRSVPKVVFSRTLREVGPSAELVREVVPPGDARPGGGGGRRGDRRGRGARRLVRRAPPGRRVPALRPSGADRPWPPDVPADGPAQLLRLLETRVFGNGVALLRYGRPDAPSSAGTPACCRP